MTDNLKMVNLIHDVLKFTINFTGVGKDSKFRRRPFSPNSGLGNADKKLFTPLKHEILHKDKLPQGCLQMLQVVSAEMASTKIYQKWLLSDNLDN